MDAQVLIVGAGPTGLTLAGELRRRGVETILIDSLEAPLSWDRATIVHPRTMELFATVGLDAELLATGVHQRYIRISSDGEQLGAMDLDENGSPFGFNVNVSEEVTERILTGHLGAHGGAARHGHRLVALTPFDDHVVATIQHDGDQYRLSAEWIVGCGGLHSPVRELSGIGFEGHDIPRQWAVLDATLAGWPPEHGYSHETNFAFLDEGSVILTPLPGDRWRAYIRPSSPTSDLVDDATRVIERYAPGVSLVDVANPTRFWCHTKVAARYRRGRALLAGDAAHICSPSQGHGMNTGIQDSFNLAFKLALVCRGEADERLLDTYEAERRPVALAVTASGDDFDSAQTLVDSGDRATRDAAIRATFADPVARHSEILAESELAVAYADSPIVTGSTGASAGPGHRLPGAIRVRDLVGDVTGHTVLVVSRDPALASEVSDTICAQHLGATDAVISLNPDDHPALSEVTDADAAIVAVRPDGYIGHLSLSTDTGPLGEYFALVRAGGR